MEFPARCSDSWSWRTDPAFPTLGGSLHYLGSRCFWFRMAARAGPFGFLHLRLREKSHFLVVNELSPTLPTSSVFPKISGLRMTKSGQRMRSSQGQAGRNKMSKRHSRDSASKLKSKVPCPAGRMALGGPLQLTQSWCEKPPPDPALADASPVDLQLCQGRSGPALLP